MTNIESRLPHLIVLLALVLSMAACSKDSTPTGPGLTLSDKEYVSQGWQQFEAQRYDSAITSFTSAFNTASSQSVKGEALSGRGWSSMYKRDLLNAKSDFTIALGLPGITSAILNDARVGDAIALYSLNGFADAASAASAALTDNPSYAFVHDAKVTTKRVRLLLVQSYFANGQFVQAAAQLDILDAARAPHASDPVTLLGSITSALNSL